MGGLDLNFLQKPVLLKLNLKQKFVLYQIQIRIQIINNNNFILG